MADLTSSSTHSEVGNRLSQRRRARKGRQRRNGERPFERCINMLATSFSVTGVAPLRFSLRALHCKRVTTCFSGKHF
jgi:hypothetical protein